MLQGGNSGNFSYPAQFGIFLGLTGAGLVLSSILTAVIWLTMTHQPLLSMQTNITNPAYYGALMVIQAVSTLFLFFLPVIFFGIICYKNVWKFTGVSTRISYRQMVWVVIILILVFPVGGALAELNKVIPIPKDWAIKFQKAEDTRRMEESVFININSFAKYVLSILIIAVLPAIVEEFFFRAGLQNIFTRWFKSPAAAIVLTSVIFSLVHLSYYGFLVRFFLGIVLGIIFYLSSSIKLSILLHFLFNGLQVTVMYVTNTGRMSGGKEVEENFPVWSGILAFVILIFVLIRFKKESKAVLEKFEYHDPGNDDFSKWIAQNS